MATYLYCVLTPTAEAPPSLAGVGGAEVRALPLHATGAEGLEAWVATVSEAAFRVSGRALGEQAMLHNDVVSAALASSRTPLPARFGSHFADDASCVKTLAARAADLRAALTRVAGSVEMAVLVAYAQPLRGKREALPERSEPFAGRRYLESVRESARLADAAEAKIVQVVTEIRAAVATTIREESRGRRVSGMITLVHLVRREDLARYREAIRELPTRDGLRIILAGPRAPYSFAGAKTLLTGHDSGSPDDND